MADYGYEYDFPGQPEGEEDGARAGANLGDGDVWEAASEREGARRDRRLHIPEALVALGIAVLLAAVPFAAHAATGDGGAGQSAASAQASGDAANASSSAAASKSASKKETGLAVSKKKTALASGKAVKTKTSDAPGIAASNGGTYLAGDLALSTAGDGSAAVAAQAGSRVSLVGSKLATEGDESPLAFSAGAVELEDVTGTAKASALASVADGGSLYVSNSTLASEFAGAQAESSLVESITGASSASAQGGNAAVSVYGTAADSPATATGAGSEGTALFQAVGSTLSSDLQSGSFFYFTNAHAKVVLSNTEVEFDSANVSLATAAGNDAGWGASGKNGASVTFTCIGEQLSGNVFADALSTVDLYLLEGTSWKGSASIATAAGSSGDTASVNIAVNVDGTSSWVLTEDATVTNLNLAPGGKLVDENGDAVKIVDADGNKLVDGASDLEVKVQGSFSTSVATTSANDAQDSAIDRAKYDEKYGTSTAFGTNGDPTTPSVEDEANELAAYITAWFKSL